MKTRFVYALVLTCAIIVSARLPVAAAQHPALATIAAFVKTANVGDRAAFLKLFTADAALVDNFAPYRFTPPSGAAKWYDGFGADAAATHQTDGVIAITKPTYLRVTGSHAWAVVPTIYTYKLKGKPQTERGLLVFTLLRSSGTWKITTMSWAQQSDTGFP